jgi:hypothetical protein
LKEELIYPKAINNTIFQYSQIIQQRIAEIRQRKIAGKEIFTLGTSGRGWEMIIIPIPQNDFPIIEKLSVNYEKGVNICRTFENKYTICCEKALYHEYLYLKESENELK